MEVTDRTHARQALVQVQDRPLMPQSMRGPETRGVAT